MNDIQPSKKPEQDLKQSLVEQPTAEPIVLPETISDEPPSLNKRLWLKRHKPLAIILGVLSILILGLLLFFVWYLWALSPVNPSDLRHDRVEIAAGSSPGQIAETLRGKKLIRSSVAFDIYTRLTGTKSNLQAGIYSISPSESTPKIVDKLTSGDITHEQVDITFYPGATLVDNSATADSKKLDVKTVLKRAGYSDSEITAAFDKTYTGPLFAGKPVGSDIEGYVYGDTYKFNKNATVEQILQRTFDEFYGVVQKNDLVDKFKSHGLNLYQGITLASI
ncbi:MAG TPA: endolytic transglycosylase MltG, partial [Candidatus Saccharibacteria bacterium]|nr:endolytic transglycosylase MltG [Candidatus Saccharibacteria bacterium]